MIELRCHICGRAFDVDRRDMLRLPLATYRACPACRECAIAPCVVTWSERSSFWSVVGPRCPFCGKRHHHGAGDDTEPDLGARLLHCITGAGGTYMLVEATQP